MEPKLNKCIICKRKTGKEDYTYEDFLKETLHDGIKCYCSECAENVSIIERHKKFSKAIKKVKVDIHESDYYLEGFIWSDKKNCWVKPDSKKEEE